MSLPKTHTMEDVDLPGMFQEGGEKRNEAFKYIYQNWKEPACRILKSKGIQDADVKNIVHKAFIIFDRKMRNEDFEVTGSLENYFIKICVNQAIVLYNRNKRTDLTDEEEKLHPKEATEQISPFFSEDCKSLIRMLLKTLDPKCREVLLYYKQGFCREAIAERADLDNANNARQRVSYCIKKLKKQKDKNSLLRDCLQHSRMIK